jgi:dTDP-4-amino-4,6-dideoxygalactose transaminase
MERRYANEIVGYNMRMTDLHAAIGRAQLGRLAGWTARRRRNAAALTAGLAGAQELGLVLPHVAATAEPVWHQYTVRAQDRDRLVAELADRGVRTGVYYPTPIHRLPAYALDLDLPVTDRVAGEVLSLPVHPALSSDQLEHVVAAVTRAVAQ